MGSHISNPLALGRLRLGHHEFEASLGYIVISKPTPKKDPVREGERKQEQYNKYQEQGEVEFTFGC